MMGDIVTDLHALAELSRSFQSAGGVGAWLSSRLAAFQALPSDTAALLRQSQAVRKVLTGSVASFDRLDSADQDLSRIQRQYPAASTRVSALVTALLPLMPKINAGTYDAEVIARLASSGGDILSTIYTVNELIATKDRAQENIERTVTNADVPNDLRQRALGALAGSSGAPTWLPMLAAAGIGVLVLRQVFK